MNGDVLLSSLPKRKHSMGLEPDMKNKCPLPYMVTYDHQTANPMMKILADGGHVVHFIPHVIIGAIVECVCFNIGIYSALYCEEPSQCFMNAAVIKVDTVMDLPFCYGMISFDDVLPACCLFHHA